MRINYTTPCSTDNLRDIRTFVSTHLVNTQLTDKEKYQIVLAIDEACANAIIHGNQCDCSRNLRLELEIRQDQIKIDIFDIGNYRPNEMSWNGRTIDDSIRDKRKGGLGQRLMYCIMDKVRYYNRGEVNVCSLTKKLK